MTSLRIISDRQDDNTIRLTVEIPPRRNGEPNFGALGRVNHVLLPVNPAAFDPPEPPTTMPEPPPEEAIPPHATRDADEDMGLKAGEALEHAP